MITLRMRNMSSVSTATVKDVPSDSFVLCSTPSHTKIVSFKNQELTPEV